MPRERLVPLAIGLLLVAGCERSTNDAAQQQQASPAVNREIQPVTPGELKELIAKHKGTPVFVDFWATWCVPCVEQYPHTVALSEQYGDRLVVYTVSMDETDEESMAAVKEFTEANGIGNTIPLHSADGGSEESYVDFDITGGALPHYKIFGRDGELFKSFGGDVDQPFGIEDIDKAVAEAVASE